MREIWKDIQGYEMLYQVSNQGRVRSLDRVVSCKNGKLNPHSKRVLQLDLNGNRITSYDSIREAAVATNSNASSITSVCRGRLIQTNGYKWQYQ
jgi:hypothetical protein